MKCSENSKNKNHCRSENILKQFCIILVRLVRETQRNRVLLKYIRNFRTYTMFYKAIVFFIFLSVFSAVSLDEKKQQ